MTLEIQGPPLRSLKAMVPVPVPKIASQYWVPEVMAGLEDRVAVFQPLAGELIVAEARSEPGLPPELAYRPIATPWAELDESI